MINNLTILNEFCTIDTTLDILRKERYRRKSFAWKTKDGKVIPIKNLSDTHLDKIISMLERNQALKELYPTEQDIY